MKEKGIMDKEIDSTELYKDLWDAVDLLPYCDSFDCRCSSMCCHIHKPKMWQAIMEVLKKHGIQNE